ncbi:membrane protein [Arthrobacter phage GoCrazy]|uniref:Membrane protein n=3 Tax=Mudcatvirus TaxID=1982088 RepID=A0AAE7VFN9_9CAUD|nr:hypothetical protein FDH65_gp76 [Arthrobacter phage Circum]YP_010666753.1 membrane protein [Arthrobacter phage Kardesai]YP_010666948.1 hypothetical protein PQB83_gp70 [Arthrobacter phage KeaneyLin]QXO13569.1 membrane protein [Arthrobacter phage GoCrazy]UYL87336.1 hypothetical protein SEA_BENITOANTONIO_73 [Arthrobacter phage BenitoAntonio]WBF79118.1 membrane protein [Arthrobacter phage Hankly]ALY08760.1 hypothetical protein CIRCUM_76 [Arthrobacter phage Circum]AXH44208.1 hypothetical prote
MEFALGLVVGAFIMFLGMIFGFCMGRYRDDKKAEKDVHIGTDQFNLSNNSPTLTPSEIYRNQPKVR